MKSPEFYRECGFEDVGYMPPELSSDEEYPDYIKEEVLKSVGEIQAHIGKNTVSFAFMTDIHYALNHNHTVRLRRTLRALREIENRTGIDMLILGGDYTNEGCKDYKKRCFRELRAHLCGEKYFPVNGNHDDGSIWDKAYINAEKAHNHLTHRELYALFYNHLPNLGAQTDENPDGLYYFYDDTAKKTRFIFIDCCDVPYIFDENGRLKYHAQWLFAMSQAQIDWLLGTALKFDGEGWSIVFATHSVLRADDAANPPEISRNMEVLRRIILAYKNGADISETFGSGDFERHINAEFSKYKRGEIAGVFVGDYHRDALDRYGSVPLVLTGNAVMYDKAPHYTKRHDGDKSELLFDVVTIDPAERKIHTVRVGAGENREIDY